MRTVAPFYADIPASLSKQRANTRINNSVHFYFFYRVCEHASFLQVVMIALCLLMLFCTMLLFACVKKTTIPFTLLFVLIARMNFRDYGNCSNESPFSTIDCP